MVFNQCYTQNTKLTNCQSQALILSKSTPEVSEVILSIDPIVID